ncbi:Pkinase-domain-containing protein [Phlegmacium glaucopus]|nr:Pkinase-domain-containing protein [Phlegmacium glaucopus]
MSEDARSTKVKKVLYVANPDSGDSEDGSEDYRRRPNGHGYPYKGPQQQVYVASRQLRPTPSQPTILTTDLPLNNLVYQQPQPQLSPDSTGSPAADESTPSPTTPNLHAPSASVDLPPRTDNPSKPFSIADAKTSSSYDRASPNETTHSITSRKGKFLQTLKAPFGSRPLRTAVDNNSPQRCRTSPTVPTPEPITSPSSITPVSAASEVKKIMATVDSERYVTVELNSTRTAAQIRELILSRLNIYNDDEQNPFAIYQTEIGSYAIGDALTNDALLVLCRDQGDSKGTLKFFVSHASASVHEPPPQPPPMEYTMPPPVLPHTVNINPLRLKQRRSRSRNGSFSSTSENIPLEVAAGYEADLDYPDRETNKSTPRPSQHLIAPPISTSANQLSPRRHPSNQNRPSSPLTQNPEPASPSPNPSDRTWAQRKEDKHPHALPAIPIPQPPLPPSVSPIRPSFTLHDEPLPIVQNPTLHSRTGSDADGVSTLKAVENGRPGPDNLSYGKSSPRVNLNDLVPSRRPLDDDDASWEMVPSNLVQRPTDDLERGVSPTISRNTARRGISRYRPSSPYASRHQANRHIINNPPTRAPPAAPSGPQETRTATQTRPARLPLSHHVFVTWKGEEGGNRKKASPASVPSNGSRLGKNVTKSMDNLKLSFSPTNRRNPLNLPITRPAGTARDLSYSPNTVTHSGIPKSYEPPRPTFVRPLPAQGSSHTNLPDVAQGSSFIQHASRSSSINLTSPSQDPFPRPQSAIGDPLISPSRSHTRLQSPFYGSTLDSGETNLSPRAVSPHRGYHSSGIPGPRPRPQPTHHSDRSDRSSDIQSGPENINSTPPRTPISPQSPRSDGFDQLPLSSLSTSVSTSGNRTSEATLKQGDHVHFANLFDQMDDKMHVVPRTLPQPERLPRQLTPPPPPEAPSARNSFGLDYEEDDDESDDGGGTWIRRPDPPKTSRPPLKVQIVGSTVLQRSADAITSEDTTPANHPPHSTLVPKPPPKTTARPGSTFIDVDSGSWAPRPPPENIYDRLDQFFSKHDLDKPVIEANSGDTSPTTAEPAVPPPPNPVNDNKARIRAKKSIRIVAEEHKKRIDRTSVADPTTLASNALRKRHTKLWGSKLEELTTFRGSSTISLPESPSSGPSKATFKWVRGELIGQGTYGRVYLALNATTGEMIAVKQVELPRTASDKNDSRQHAVVQALKMESETLKDLDHPHIVQYLGFEETPSNLSIFLEYVPGGSVGSCLHRHGKFDDNVTRSFTTQILSGLEYLHSRGILHRDLKADNILVEMSGTCKISDFGISKRTEDVDGGAHTAMQGTIFWMAPEVVHTKKEGYNFKIDIWSVGCVVLEMWAGKRPWVGEETVVVMYKLFQSKLPPPVPEDVVLGEDADDFRRKCFAINPEERPSAAELRKHSYLLVPSDWEFTGFT